MNDNNSAMKEAVLTKMAYDRTGAYISSAYAILHLCREEELDNAPVFESLRHVLGMLSHEIDELSSRLDREMMKSMKAVSQQDGGEDKKVYA